MKRLGKGPLIAANVFFFVFIVPAIVNWDRISPAQKPAAITGLIMSSILVIVFLGASVFDYVRSRKKEH